MQPGQPNGNFALVTSSSSFEEVLLSPNARLANDRDRREGLRYAPDRRTLLS